MPTRWTISLLAGAGAICLGMLAGRAEDPPATQPALTGTLSLGVKVELLGLFDAWDQAAASWTPDGAPTATRPATPEGGRVRTYPQNGELSAMLSLRTTFPEKSALTTAVSLEGARSGGTSSSTDHGVRMEVIAASFPKTLKSTTVRINVAAGPWKTLAAGDAKTAAVAGGVTAGAASVNDGSVAVTFTFQEPPDAAAKVDRRYVLTDVAGKEHPSNRVAGTSDENVQTRTVSFAQVRLQDVAKVRVDERPYDQWIEFRNISLLPGIATKPEVTTSDAPQAR